MVCYGPVPSRRLGKSLGINNIPFEKVCSYSCIYCQVGLTKYLRYTREPYIEPEKIYGDVVTLLEKLQPADYPDYLTFVANGEPTLDINLGRSISLLKVLGIPVAVITNASLLYDKEVRKDISQADWVSVKVDSAVPAIRKRINRPFPGLTYDLYCEGLTLFANSYNGVLATETMLVQGVNDGVDSLDKTASLIKNLKPQVSYISVPIRPPAIHSARLPEEEKINTAYQIFTEKGLNSELLVDFEGIDIGYTGNAKVDILNMCVVHPIREETMYEILNKDGSDSNIVEQLISSGQIKKIEYKGKMFYLRNFSK
ncbi:MAG: radical SAM protein [Rikenellaceae bacterium]|nr:radical SAM protein [Rikenellaceae bacterium]